MKVRVLAVAATVTLLLVGPLASTAHAATSQGCTGSISSTGAEESTLDTITVPGPGGTNANPFHLYWAYPITWTARTFTQVSDGTWRLTVPHASWLFALGELVSGHTHGLSGTFSSGQGGTSFTNTFTPSAIEPVALPGKYEIGFTVTGSGAVVCAGTMSVRVMDPPGRNPMWWLAFLLIIAGLVMLFFFGVSKWTRPAIARTNERGERKNKARTRHVASNTIAGLFLGIGVSLMTTLYGAVGWNSVTPDVIIVVGVVLGLGVGLLPVRTVAQPVMAAAARPKYSSLST